MFERENLNRVSHTPTRSISQVETRKGKKRRATLLSAAKSEFQKKLETMVQQMNASQDSKMESLHDEYVVFWCLSSVSVRENHSNTLK